MKKVELVVPGGSLEKLRYAMIYGADAVYVAGKDFSLRAKSKNFEIEDLIEAASFVKQQQKKIYLALNIFAHNEHIERIPAFLREIKDIPFDAVIVSDPGILSLVKESLPQISIHLSTQANSTNWRSVAFWEKQGVSRVVLARELTLEEIKEIREKTNLELEVFVHGAMCVAYSGRCLLSKYFTGRESNLGDCSHPCRWFYDLKEQNREGQILPVLSTDQGALLLSSKDLCMIDYIKELSLAGVNAFKIEGRMKSIFYVTNVTRTYREALDELNQNYENFKGNPDWAKELDKVSHREYSTGFFFDSSIENAQLTDKVATKREAKFLATIKEILGDGWYNLEVRNKIRKGDNIEIIAPLRLNDNFSVIEQIKTKEGVEIDQANPNQDVVVKIPGNIALYYILREKQD